MNQDEKANIVKLIVGVAVMVPWVLYQLQPLWEGIVIDGWELVFTIMMVAGMIVLSTIKKQSNLEKIKEKGKVKIPRL